MAYNNKPGPIDTVAHLLSVGPNGLMNLGKELNEVNDVYNYRMDINNKYYYYIQELIPIVYSNMLVKNSLSDMAKMVNSACGTTTATCDVDLVIKNMLQLFLKKTHDERGQAIISHINDLCDNRIGFSDFEMGVLVKEYLDDIGLSAPREQFNFDMNYSIKQSFSDDPSTKPALDIIRDMSEDALWGHPLVNSTLLSIISRDASRLAAHVFNTRGVPEGYELNPDDLNNLIHYSTLYFKVAMYVEGAVSDEFYETIGLSSKFKDKDLVRTKLRSIMPELDLLYGSSGDKEKDLAAFKTNFEQLRNYVQAFYEASVNWSEENGYLKESYDRYHHIVETFKNAAQELNENMLLRSFMTSLDMVVWDKMLDNNIYKLEPAAVIDDVFKKLLASSIPEQQDTQLNRGM